MLHIFWHEGEISQLGKAEIDFSISYAALKKKYYKKLDSFHYEDKEVSSPTRIIWWCWLQGEEQAPPLCKSCLESLKRNLPQYEIKVVTEQNILSYIHLPQHILLKYKAGIISHTHYSDIVRTQLLVEHGGVWIDSTVFCTGYNIPIFDYPLFVYQNWKFNIPQIMVASSWLISAKKGHPILCSVRDLLFEYWKDNDKLMNYYIYHFFFQMATEHYAELWNAVPRFSNIPPHILQFEMFNQYDSQRFEQICQMSDFHKLTWKHKTDQMNLSGTYYEWLCQQR